MKTLKLGMLIGVAALALACGQAKDTADATTGEPQSFSEAARELESDVAADVSAGADTAAQAAQDAIDEGVKTE